MIFFIPRRLHNPKLILHFQKLFSSFFFISHTFPQPHYADKSPNHSDAQQHTTTYNNTRRLTPIQSFSSVTTTTHTQVWTLSYVVSFLYVFLFFFYAYGFYWLVVMAPSSASVFLVDKRLFWGFDDDRNNTVVITFFVVVIVPLASIVKPLLLCSLLYSQTSSLLFLMAAFFIFEPYYYW